MDRALPDVRDGLKPSQRRILVAMNDLNLRPRLQAPQVRQDRRRHLRRLPPARRGDRLPDARPPGAGLGPALPADRRAGQLRLHRRRPARRHALHRGPHDRASRRSCWPTWTSTPSTSSPTTTTGCRSRPSCRASSPTCSSTARPASPSAWRATCCRTTCARSATRSSTCIDKPDVHARRAARDRPRPGLPDRRHHLRPGRHRRRLHAPAAARSRLRAKIDVEEQQGRSKPIIVIDETAVQRHPQDDRRERSPTAVKNGLHQRHLRRQRPLRPRSTSAASSSS